MLNWLRFRWQIFEYNYHWSDYSIFFHGVLPRVSTAIPLAGYLVLFNDGVTQYLNFQILTSDVQHQGFLISYARLRLVYFGLVLLGFGTLIYYVRRPYVIKLGETFEDYKAAIMRLASPSIFVEMDSLIRRSGFDPWTRGGKYYDRDFEDFYEVATGTRRGQSIREAYANGSRANWPEAAARYEPLLTGMLQETYFREGRKRRIALTCSLLSAITGYAFLFVPSADLFFRVLLATLR
jgi:hypothetical protein